MSSLSSLFPRFDSTLGAIFLGNNVASCLFGITSIQTYLYYNHSVHDGKFLKAVVAVLWILDAVHLATIWHVIYFYTVTNYANPLVLIGPQIWSFTACTAITGVSDCIVRGIYAYRIWKLSANRVLLAVILFNMTNNLAASSVLAIEQEFPPRTFTNYRDMSWAYYWTLASIAFSDTVIAVILWMLLMKRSSSSSIKRSNSILRMLMIYGVSTGALTGVCALMALMAYAAFGDTLIFAGLLFILQKLYLNAVLATLNGREQLRKKFHRSSIIELAPSSQASKDTAVSNEVFDSQKQDTELGISK